MSHDYTCTNAYYKTHFLSSPFKLSIIALSFKLDFLFLSKNKNKKKIFFLYKGNHLIVDGSNPNTFNTAPLDYQ